MIFLKNVSWLVNSFIRAQGVLVTLDNRRLYALQRFALQEWPTPCLVRALCVDELTPTRQDLMKYDGDEIYWKSDAGGCGLHGYFAASLMNEDECIYSLVLICINVYIISCALSCMIDLISTFFGVAAWTSQRGLLALFTRVPCWKLMVIWTKRYWESESPWHKMLFENCVRSQSLVCL